jgi:hypothetical protein
MKPWLERTLVGVLGTSLLFGGLAAWSHSEHGCGHGWRALSAEDAAPDKQSHAASAPLQALGGTCPPCRTVRRIRSPKVRVETALDSSPWHTSLFDAPISQPHWLTARSC